MRSWVPAVGLGLALAGGFACYGQPQGPASQWLGKQAKSVALKTTNGTTLDPGREFGKRPVVLVFYRGVW